MVIPGSPDAGSVELGIRTSEGVAVGLVEVIDLWRKVFSLASGRNMLGRLSGGASSTRSLSDGVGCTPVLVGGDESRNMLGRWGPLRRQKYFVLGCHGLH